MVRAGDREVAGRGAHLPRWTGQGTSPLHPDSTAQSTSFPPFQVHLRALRPPTHPFGIMIYDHTTGHSILCGPETDRIFATTEGSENHCNAWWTGGSRAREVSCSIRECILG